MVARIVLIAALAVAGVVAGGCQTGQARGDQLMVAMAPVPAPVPPSGAQLFGPTPLRRGQEDLGYFAYLPPQPEQVDLYNFQANILVKRTWDVEDSLRPGLSYTRTRTFSKEIRSSYR